MEEIWKEIKGSDGRYLISNQGRVFGVQRNKLRTIGLDKDGYQVVSFKVNNKMKMCKVHRLVAEAFIPNPDNLPQVNHKNEIKSDNNVSNLEWCSASYNTNYGTRNDRVRKKELNKFVSEEAREKMRAAKLKKSNKGKHWTIINNKRIWY